MPTVILSNQSRYKNIPEDKLAALAEHVLRNYERTESELSITFVDRQTIRSLNQRYFNKNDDTDVISFHLGKAAGNLEIGDLYICPQVAEANAVQYGCTVEEELARLVIHGVLHFIGYDDQEESDRQFMHELENKFLENYREGKIY